jgi:hypothetical protein
LSNGGDAVRITTPYVAVFILFISGSIFPGCKTVNRRGEIKVVNGVEESGFPYVVQLRIDESGGCTGSFVSSDLMITAAHCVARAKTVALVDEKGSVGAKVTRENFFIHPNWPTGGAACEKRGEAKYDVALIRFPRGTYKGDTFAELSGAAPEAGDSIKIVGFGHNKVEVFNEYCRLSSRKADTAGEFDGVYDDPQPIDDLDEGKKEEETGYCVLRKGALKSAARHIYEEVFRYPHETPAIPPASGKEQSKVETAGCPVRCSRDGLIRAVTADGREWNHFLRDTCGGNLRDRPYKETGAGTKRSGVNNLSYAGLGIFKFYGVTAGSDETPDGIDAVSGAGDSGGPLFVEKNGRWLLAGVTHGGGLVERSKSVQKFSVYVNLNYFAVRDWLVEIVEQEKLDFPGAIVIL